MACKPAPLKISPIFPSSFLLPWAQAAWIWSIVSFVLIIANFSTKSQCPSYRNLHLLHLVLRKTGHPTSHPSPSSLRWSSSLYHRLPVVCLEASIFFVKFSTPIAWYHLLLSFHQSLKACSILVLALPVSSTAGAGRGPDGLLGGSLQMMIVMMMTMMNMMMAMT